MGLKPTRIQFIRNFTVEPLGEALAAVPDSNPPQVELSYGAYANVVPELMRLASDHDNAPDLVIIALHQDFLGSGIHSASWSLDEAKAELDQILAAVARLPVHIHALIANFVPDNRITWPLMGPGSLSGRNGAVLDLNLAIRDFVLSRPHQCGLLDFQKIAASLGDSQTHDPRFALMMKAPFKPAFFAAAAQEVSRYLEARRTSAKKVLILDCDNTLWGGVVGEEGREGIQLDPYEYPGIAFFRFQFSVLQLAERGILVCLCSKNDEASVMDVLDNHPHCQIRRHHIAAHRINWNDKAGSIRELASELNLGLDSMVFVDDSPAECERVRAALPGVAVVQVPSKPYLHCSTLQDLHFFDKTTVSREDSERLSYYRADRARKQVEDQVLDQDAFLKNLEMRAVVRRMRDADLPRAAQLCQRTNQFNVTTRRHTEQDLAALAGRPDAAIFLLEAADRFGPIGLSGLLILLSEPPAAVVETFLLSCRIIGRKFDRALLFRALQIARTEWSFDKIVGSYIATPKNGIVKNLYPEYGFERVDGQAEFCFEAPASVIDSSIPEEISLVEKL